MYLVELKQLLPQWESNHQVQKREYQILKKKMEAWLAAYPLLIDELSRYFVQMIE